MINQFSSYSDPPSAFREIVANSVSVLDKYIIMQTGDYQYTALIQDVVTGEVEKIVCSRNTSGSYSGYYNIVRSSDASFEYDISNEYYVYSNVGVGRSLDIPSYEGVRTYSITSLVCLVFFAVIFKGVLFRCLRKK